MRYCKQCGNPLAEGKKFCTKCGAAVSEVASAVKEEKKEKPEKKKKIGFWRKLRNILLGFLLCAVAFAVIFLVTYLSAGAKLKRSIFAEKWAEAGTIYENMRAGGKAEQAEQVIENTAAEIQKKYIHRQLSYEDAAACLEGMKSFNDGEQIKEALEYIEALEASRKAYELAEKYWQEADYEKAILQYQQVIEADENYTAATGRVKEGLGLYKDQVLKEIEELASGKQYGEAIQKIAIAQDILGEDADLTVLATKYEKAGLEGALKEYEAAEDYGSAIMLLQKQASLLEADSGLKSRFETMKTKYRETLFQQAMGLYKESGYEAAVGCLSQGLQVLPEDNEIQEMIEKYRSCAPVDLETLRVLSTNKETSLDNKFENGSIEDLYGNQYNGYFLLWTSAHERKPYVEFLADGNYSHFRGTYFVDTNTNETYSAKFTIYADGVEIYNSGYINRKAKAVEFDLSINHAESIRIEAASGDGYFSSTPGVILANAEVYNMME